MPTFALPRYLDNHQSRIDHAQKLESVIRDAGGTVQQAKHAAHTASDGLTLRGIPAIGRGVAGAIRFTRPEDAIR